jgi:hypothetical protein
MLQGFLKKFNGESSFRDIFGRGASHQQFSGDGAHPGAHEIGFGLHDGLIFDHNTGKPLGDFTMEILHGLMGGTSFTEGGLRFQCELPCFP